MCELIRIVIQIVVCLAGNMFNDIRSFEDVKTGSPDTESRILSCRHVSVVYLNTNVTIKAIRHMKGNQTRCLCCVDCKLAEKRGYKLQLASLRFEAGVIGVGPFYTPTCDQRRGQAAKMFFFCGFYI